MSEPAYLTWSNQKEFAKIAASMGQTVDAYDGIYKSHGTRLGERTFTDFDTNVSVRSEYNRSDYEYFRNAEARNESLQTYSCC
jgi:hypothetical protein